MGDLGELGQLDYPRRQRYPLTFALTGPALAVPALVGGDERVQRARRQPELVTE
ncbi:MAG TPA: hypothetical protein VFV73_42875 [Streptosporangiaceae bacterium]|nr:hypothetical protein [Streptosporangiaceae bacterium]